MLFFTYDLEQYRDQLRGFYFDFEAEAPGPLLASSDEVLAAVRDVGAASRSATRAAYQAFAAKYCPLDDGKAGARVCDRLFGWLTSATGPGGLIIQPPVSQLRAWYRLGRTSVTDRPDPALAERAGDGDPMVPVFHVVLDRRSGRARRDPCRDHSDVGVYPLKRSRGSCEVGRKWRSKHVIGSTDPTIRAIGTSSWRVPPAIVASPSTGRRSPRTPGRTATRPGLASRASAGRARRSSGRRPGNPVCMASLPRPPAIVLPCA